MIQNYSEGPEKMNKKMAKVLHYISWRDWSIINFNSCVENIFIFFYIALVQQEYGWNFITNFFLFYLFSSFSMSYGYLINDLSDMELDRLHAKQNVFENDSKLKAIIVVSFFFLLTNLLAYPFFGKKHFLILWGLWVFVATFYSLKPFRFKEKGAKGLFIVVTAQRVLPTLLIFSAFDFPINLYTSPIIIYIANRGFISDVRHQIKDLSNDLSTKTKTFAVEIGIEKAKKIFSFLLYLDLFLFSVFMSVFFTKLPWLEIGGLKINFFSLLFIAYVMVLFFHFIQVFNRKNKTNYDPHYETGYLNLLHIAIPSIYLPLWILIFLCFKFFGNILILTFFIILITKMFSKENVKSIFFYSILKKLFKFI